MSRIEANSPGATRNEDIRTTTDRLPTPDVNRTMQFLRAAGICIIALPWGIALFTLLITGLAPGGGLVITFVGVPILAWTLHLAGLAARLEDRIVRSSTGSRSVWRLRPGGPRTWAGSWTVIRDPAAWDDLTRGVMRMPFGILSFTVTVSLLATSVSYLTAPLIYGWAGIWTITGEVGTLGDAFLAVPQGVLAAAVAAYVIPRLANQFERSIR